MYYKDYKEKKPQHDGWYIRQENNGWRPVRIEERIRILNFLIVTNKSTSEERFC